MHLHSCSTAPAAGAAAGAAPALGQKVGSSCLTAYHCEPPVEPHGAPQSRGQGHAAHESCKPNPRWKQRRATWDGRHSQTGAHGPVAYFVHRRRSGQKCKVSEIVFCLGFVRHRAGSSHSPRARRRRRERCSRKGLAGGNVAGPSLKDESCQEQR